LLQQGRLFQRWQRFDRAQACFEEMLAIWREIGDLEGEASALSLLARLARDRGDRKRERRFLEESLLLARKLGNSIREARCLHALSRCAWDEAEVSSLRARAADAFLESWERVAPGLEEKALRHLARGEPEEAAVFLGAAAAIRAQFARIHGPVALAATPEKESELARAREQARSALGEEAFATAWRKGEALTLEQAVLILLDDE
jgi:hypothetical protein